MKETMFTVQELAKYLKMKPVTIYKHASKGKIPGFKVGSHWRFKKKTIDKWIEEQEKRFPLAGIKLEKKNTTKNVG